jgi:hypothetical protein
MSKSSNFTWVAWISCMVNNKFLYLIRKLEKAGSLALCYEHRNYTVLQEVVCEDMC